jgi:hypothetical protein
MDKFKKLNGDSSESRFLPQNAQKLSYNLKNIAGVIPQTPVKMGKGWDGAGGGEGGEWKGEERGSCVPNNFRSVVPPLHGLYPKENSKQTLYKSA